MNNSIFLEMNYMETITILEELKNGLRGVRPELKTQILDHVLIKKKIIKNII